jgi:ferritin-like metal-binding protein YciE
MPTKNNKQAAAAAASRTPEAESALKELFVDELKDIYWAEKHLAAALPKLIKGATSEDLKQTITTHLEETKNQIDRLESVFNSVGEKAAAKKCLAMEEHYEIASYGTLRTLAGTLGYSEAQSLLDETLAEEKNADSLLTQVAENYVNEAAAAEVE